MRETDIRPQDLLAEYLRLNDEDGRRLLDGGVELAENPKPLSTATPDFQNLFRIVLVYDCKRWRLPRGAGRMGDARGWAYARGALEHDAVFLEQSAYRAGGLVWLMPEVPLSAHPAVRSMVVRREARLSPSSLKR